MDRSFFIIIYYSQDKLFEMMMVWILILISLRLNLVKDVGFNPPFNSYGYRQDKLFEMAEGWIQEIISLRLKEDRSGWRDFVALLVKSVEGGLSPGFNLTEINSGRGLTKWQTDNLSYLLTKIN